VFKQQNNRIQYARNLPEKEQALREAYEQERITVVEKIYFYLKCIYILSAILYRPNDIY
jgi:hypothetical protein